ncbi:hypothetical protein [Desulforhopalus singaporensis]|uniref:SCP-2 sterol transfer family protein n=1 Tax=Desulforhopalus singaporensis TaxID=91360 RepID=A0A1H0T103_9BACT|nr:hypothetical protein [Desulforhopalus singaporensis]SDP47762.1 hypothetical protein SAMN05660330_02904 [Desulforhopalus singaporensis]
MGKYITNIDQLYKGISGMFGSADQVPEVKQKILNTGLVLELHYLNPEGKIVIDASSGEQIKVYTGEWPDSVNPKVKMEMDSDIAHLYWLGKVNFMMATLKKDIRTVGNLGEVLKLVPVLGPLFGLYINFLKNNGMGDLVV